MSVARISRNVVKKVFAVEQAEGQGARVRRSIGSGALRNLTPFLMLDHFRDVGSGAGFPDHPHRGQATVTYMIQGSMNHEDSLGNKGSLLAGGVQWMCAGKGIIHAEMPVVGAGVPLPVGFQLWVDLPKQYKMVEPSYQDLSPEGVPVAYPEGPEGPVSVRVISGKSHGVESPVRPLGGCWYFHVKLDKKGSNIFQDIPANWTTFAYIFKGRVAVGDTPTAYESYHTIVFSNEPEATGVSITAEEDGTELILIAGEPLDQPVFQYGPFVMNTKQEVEKALIDYRSGSNGFEKAHIWKSEIGGLRD
ncbi:pirin domain-containing protein [Ephemerocybe angulata]|nr:pirin domain-containing protein [Tulosesus angulatus]